MKSKIFGKTYRHRDMGGMVASVHGADSLVVVDGRGLECWGVGCVIPQVYLSNHLVVRKMTI